VPKAVQIGQTNHHPQKKPFPRQAGLVQVVFGVFAILIACKK
jgi:hypothetical protein